MRCIVFPAFWLVERVFRKLMRWSCLEIGNILERGSGIGGFRDIFGKSFRRYFRFPNKATSLTFGKPSPPIRRLERPQCSYIDPQCCWDLMYSISNRFSRVSLVWWSYLVVFLRITSLFNELERGEEIKEILGRGRTCDLRIWLTLYTWSQLDYRGSRVKVQRNFSIES